MKKFITFEGIEGCGKSTQARLLHEFLLQKNYESVLTREPGGTKVGEKIRAILIDEDHEKLERESEVLLNFAARLEHVRKLIAPSLKNGAFVVCDRFIDSTFAYQGYGFGADLEMISQIEKIAIGDFTPDITFLIDVPVDLAFERIRERSSNNRYENFPREFHEKVRVGFLQIAKKNSRVRIIDGTKNITEIAAEIRRVLGVLD